MAGSKAGTLKGKCCSIQLSIKLQAPLWHWPASPAGQLVPAALPAQSSAGAGDASLAGGLRERERLRSLATGLLDLAGLRLRLRLRSLRAGLLDLAGLRPRLLLPRRGERERL